MKELKNLTIEELLEELLLLSSDKEKNICSLQQYRRILEEINLIKEEIIRRVY